MQFVLTRTPVSTEFACDQRRFTISPRPAQPDVDEGATAMSHQRLLAP